MQCGDGTSRVPGCDHYFHLACVGLTAVPRGDWRCRECDGGAPRAPAVVEAVEEAVVAQAAETLPPRRVVAQAAETLPPRRVVAQAAETLPPRRRETEHREDGGRKRRKQR